MHNLVKLFLTLLTGGLLTSLAEYHFKYSLIGTVYGLFKKAEADVVKAKADIKVEFKKV